MQLSVIIPTRNRSSFLNDALQSITKQTLSLDNVEVIVVDNGSSDNTKDVVLAYKAQIPNLSYIYDEKPGLHVGRHHGYKQAKSDILVFADDDIEATPTWLEGILESFESQEVVLVGGKNSPKFEGTVPFWITEKWHKLNDFGHCMPELSLIDFGEETKEIPAYYVYGCNFAIRKEILDKTTGFHPDGMPFELIEFRGDGESFVSKYIQEHHLKSLYNPKASVFHKVPKERMTLDYFKKRAFCQGVEMSYIDLRYGTQRAKISFLQKLKIFVYNMLRFANIDKIEATQQQTDREKEINLSRQIGYIYHKKKYQSSQTLKDWVHKNNYLD